MFLNEAWKAGQLWECIWLVYGRAATSWKTLGMAAVPLFCGSHLAWGCLENKTFGVIFNWTV